MAGLTYSNAMALPRSQHQGRLYYGIRIPDARCIHHWKIAGEVTACPTRGHRHKWSYPAMCIKCTGERCFRAVRWTWTIIIPKSPLGSIKLGQQMLDDNLADTILASENADRIASNIESLELQRNVSFPSRMVYA